jgi:hypothetical protein
MHKSSKQKVTRRSSKKILSSPSPDAPSPSPQPESESKSESLKNWTRVRVRVLQVCRSDTLLLLAPANQNKYVHSKLNFMQVLGDSTGIYDYLGIHSTESADFVVVCFGCHFTCSFIFAFMYPCFRIFEFCVDSFYKC